VYKYVGSDNLVFFLSHCTEIENTTYQTIIKIRQKREKDGEKRKRDKNYILIHMGKLHNARLKILLCKAS
jgi:hypothetical protein